MGGRSVNIWSNWPDTIFVNAPIPKVICSVSDSFSECCAPDVNGVFSWLFLERNLVITVLAWRLGFFCQTDTNMEHIHLVRCEQFSYGPVLTRLIFQSIIYIASNRFPNLKSSPEGAPWKLYTDCMKSFAVVKSFPTRKKDLPWFALICLDLPCPLLLEL